MLTEQQILALQNQYPKLTPILKKFDLSEELRNPNSETYKAFATWAENADIKDRLELTTNTQSQFQTAFQTAREKLKEFTMPGRAVEAKKNISNEYKKDAELLKTLLAQFKEIQEAIKNKTKEFDKITALQMTSLKQQFSNEEKLLKLLSKEKPNLNTAEAKSIVKNLLNSNEADQIKQLTAVKFDQPALTKVFVILEEDKEIKNQMKQQQKQAEEINKELNQLMDKTQALTSGLLNMGQQLDQAQNEPQDWMRAGWNIPKMGLGKQSKDEEDEEDEIPSPGMKNF